MLRHKSRTQIFKPFLFFIFLSLFSTSLYSNRVGSCLTTTGQENKVAHRLLTRLTQVESLFRPQLRPLTVDEMLTLKIEELRVIDSELAAQVVEARRAQERGESLKLPLSHLPVFMVNFLRGRYEQIIGKRGLSKPFMSLELFDEQTLLIQHLEDKYPLLVRWSEGVKDLSPVKEVEIEGQVYRMLEFPAEIKSRADMRNLSSSYIFKHISASRLHRYQDSRSSLIMMIASLLHERRLIFDRASQMDFLDIRKELDENWESRKKVRSLLFVAPTAVGKTRIIGHSVAQKVFKTKQILERNRRYKKKLSLVMTKTPDLAGKLAVDIGEQLVHQVGAKNYRILQWGGALSEKMTFSDLKIFIQKSKVPVVLVTSYMTLGARVKGKHVDELMSMMNQLTIDEAHNATGTIFRRIFLAAQAEAKQNRKNDRRLDVLDILGTTASPITRTQRTVELYDSAYSASIDTPKAYSHSLQTGQNFETDKRSSHPEMLEHRRTLAQYENARDRGEITAPDHVLYFRPQDYGYSFLSIYRRKPGGTHSYVDLNKLREVWPDLENLIRGRKNGIVYTAPRDADGVAETLSELSGQNFVSLNRSQNEREKIYAAFKSGTEHRGQKIDAIVGKVREGLDFPRAEFFISFVRYPKYPENIQSQGRVVRIALDKLPPVIIYFSEETERAAFRDVAELILRRIGLLPRTVSNSRYYTSARKVDESSYLGKTINALNESLEAVIRMNGASVRGLNLSARRKLKPAEKQNLEDAILVAQKTLIKIRRTNFNREIAQALKNFIAEVNTYPFFKGTLKETWNYCERVLRAAKKGAPYSSRVTEDMLTLIEDEKLLALVQEFRAMRSWIGKVPRLVIENVNLRPNNLYETIEATEAFIRNRGVIPYTLFVDDEKSLDKRVVDYARTSSSTFWAKLSYRSRSLLEDVFFQDYSEQSFETALQSYFDHHGQVPLINYSLIPNPQRSTVAQIGHKLALRMEIYLRRGSLDVGQLSRELLEALDSSEYYRDLLEEMLVKIDVEELKKEAFIYVDERTSLEDLAELLKPSELQKLEDFSLLRVVLKLAERGYIHSENFKTELEDKVERALKN